MAFTKKLIFIFLFFFLLNACASFDALKIEEEAFEKGSLLVTVQTYDLLLQENYELLKLMDEEGDTEPSRHRNLIVARLNSALYHLGGMIKSMEGNVLWPQSVIVSFLTEEYVENNRQFAKTLKNRWEREWKESFDDEDGDGYRELAIETYLKYGNAFKLPPREKAVKQ